MVVLLTPPIVVMVVADLGHDIIPLSLPWLIDSGWISGLCEFVKGKTLEILNRIGSKMILYTCTLQIGGNIIVVFQDC